MRRSALAILLAAGALSAIGTGLGAARSHPTRTYRVPSGSMLPTLAVGERIEVQTDAYRSAHPKRYDIVVFHPPVGADEGRCGNPREGPGSAAGGPASRRSCSKPTRGLSRALFIKRVIALPGDRVALRHGRAVVNGRMLPEHYIRRCGGAPECTLGAIRVRPRTYFVLGDNRGESDDSRYWGPTPRRGIVGRVTRRLPPTPAR